MKRSTFFTYLDIAKISSETVRRYFASAQPERFQIYF